jgi:hypothetical protein
MHNPINPYWHRPPVNLAAWYLKFRITWPLINSHIVSFLQSRTREKKQNAGRLFIDYIYFNMYSFTRRRYQLCVLNNFFKNVLKTRINVLSICHMFSRPKLTVLPDYFAIFIVLCIMYMQTFKLRSLHL